MLRAIIPAAGKGTRSGLPFPKTLQEVDGSPILVRLLKQLLPIDPCPAVITSLMGKKPIEDTIEAYGLSAEILIQEKPRGMGDAVGRFQQSSGYGTTDELLVIWGDMLSLSQPIIEECLSRFRADRADFAFPTSQQNPCYTCVSRAPDNSVSRVVERRELGDAMPQSGEADCGVFIFRKEPLFTLLQDHEDELVGPVTGEINFLPTIGALADRGFSVQAYPIASVGDAFSFNSPADLEAFDRFKFRSGKTSN